MANDQDFIDYVVDQVDADLTYRHMFGGTTLYLNGKVVALICDNQLFVKPTEAGRAYIGHVVEAPAYEGAKNSFLIEDQVDDTEWLTGLFAVTENELPAPKPKKKEVNMKKIVAALLLILPVFVLAQEDEKPEPGFNEATFKGLEMRSVGPALMSGRIADIVIDPTDPSVWYVGVGSGGVWKTVNAGTTWTPIFDDQGSYSIGCIALDPNNPNVVWVGTGENVSGRHVAYGDGVYRSRDGGKTWENMGLENSEHIGMIRIDPRDSDTIFVAAQGPLWSGGGDRGLYKSTDGGESWRKVLGDGLGNTEEDDQYTGVSEVFMDPRDPDVMYAVAWQRLRNVEVVINGGPGTGIHKSEDGGETWRELTNGLPQDMMGKTGLAISPQNPDTIYATIELALRSGGFWRSEDGGESWEKRSDYLSGGTGPHYYQEIFASPHVFDRVYQMDVVMHVTEDGGKTFQQVPELTKHIDNHALWIDPDDTEHVIIGGDGGLYETWDGGANWQFKSNLPLAQFYKIAVDNDVPFYNVYGGTQDNFTLGGPSRTSSVHGITNREWVSLRSGDGFDPVVDPENPDIVYVGALGRLYGPSEERGLFRTRDGGQSWETRSDSISYVASGVHFVSTSRGWLAATQGQGASGQGFVLHTSDGGVSFSSISANPGDDTQADQVFPGVFVDPKGNVHVSYYDRRLDSRNLLLWTWVARSSDGGASGSFGGGPLHTATKAGRSRSSPMR